MLYKKKKKYVKDGDERWKEHGETTLPEVRLRRNRILRTRTQYIILST